MHVTENGEFNPENCRTTLKDSHRQRNRTGKDFLLCPPQMHPQSHSSLEPEGSECKTQGIKSVPLL